MFGTRRAGEQAPADPSGEPLSNSAVVEAMGNLAIADTPAARASLYQLLLDATLLAATPEPIAAPGSRAQADETLDLVTSLDQDGVVLPLFTSEATLLRWRERPTGCVALPARTVLELAAANDMSRIVLDPGSPIGGVLTRHEIAELARGRLPVDGRSGVVTAATQVRMGRPADPPSPVVLAAIDQQLKSCAAAARAWYFLMQEGENEPEMVIAIELSGLRSDQVPDTMHAIIDGAGNACPDVDSVVFLVAEGSLLQTLSEGAGVLFHARG